MVEHCTDAREAARDGEKPVPDALSHLRHASGHVKVWHARHEVDDGLGEREVAHTWPRSRENWRRVAHRLSSSSSSSSSSACVRALTRRAVFAIPAAPLRCLLTISEFDVVFSMPLEREDEDAHRCRDFGREQHRGGHGCLPPKEKQFRGGEGDESLLPLEDPSFARGPCVRAVAGFVPLLLLLFLLRISSISDPAGSEIDGSG